MTAIDLQGVLAWLRQKPQGVVLCINSALQREVMLQVLSGNESAARVDRVLNLDSWLASLTREAALDGGLALASRAQQQLVWRDVIEHQKPSRSETDLDPVSLSAEAMQAHEQMLHWQVPPDRIADAESFSELRFSDWCQQFEAQLLAFGLTTSSMVLSDLENLTEPHTPAMLLTTGGGVSPLVSRLLTSSFTSLLEASLQSGEAVCQRYQCDTPVEEARAAGVWAQQQWQAQPGCRIAIISTDRQLTPPALRREILRPLEEAIPFQFNFARREGNNLLRPAYSLLLLNRARIARPLARTLINSRFWSNLNDELEVRNAWERGTCDLQLHDISFRQLVTELRHAANHVPECAGAESLLARLEQFAQCRRDNPAAASIGDWMLIFSQQLYCLGWPGKTGESDQALKLWSDLCLEMAALGAVQPPCGLKTVLALLGEQINNLKTAPDRTAPGINLLDTLESAVGFDAIWLMGANHQSWPAPAQGNSLIPLPVQAEFELPRHSPEQEYRLCQQLFAHLQRNAAQLVFSISCPDPDQAPGFSALLPPCPALPLQSDWEKPEPAPAMEWVDCSKAPACEVTDEPFPGGSNLLDLMLGSPFVAFARWRLAADELAQPSDGLDAMQRGTLVHKALEKVWGELDGSEQLQRTTDSAREQLVVGAVDSAMADIARQSQAPLTCLEPGLRSWLIRLLNGWLDMECSRESFRIEGLEQVREVVLGGMRVRLKLDRIDRLEQERILVIDYKTGSTQISQLGLLDSPPASAQLPLYALSLDNPPSAICIGSVVPDNPAIRGVGSGLMLSGIKELENWNELLAQWREDLEAVAARFVEGRSEHWCRELRHGQKDPLAALHRQAEREQLEALDDDR